MIYLTLANKIDLVYMISNIHIKGSVETEALKACYCLSLLSYCVRDRVSQINNNSTNIKDLIDFYLHTRKKNLLSMSETFKLFDRNHDHQIILSTYESGLDVICYMDKDQVIVAADGTDPHSNFRGELIGDLKDGVRIFVGLRPKQLNDLKEFYSEIRSFCHNRVMYSTGHSLGGHLQGLALSEIDLNVRKVVMFNSPGYSRGLIKSLKLYEQSSKVLSLSAFEPISLIGKHFGKRIWFPRCYSHSLLALHKYIF
jgi:hypothetical protein